MSHFWFPAGFEMWKREELSQGMKKSDILQQEQIERK